MARDLATMIGSSEGRISVVGDRNPTNPTHVATDAALVHVPLALPFEWCGTDEIGADPAARLSGYSGLLIAPGSPYRNMEGALRAIRFAREEGVPLLATCGGFQHVVVEYARNVLGLVNADHEESEPHASELVVTALSCSLAGQNHSVRLVPGTQAAELYAADEVSEPFYCNYGLNPEYRRTVEDGGLIVSGVGEHGEVRILELPGNPFFVATLFVPQARSTAREPHPLVAAFITAARQTIRDRAALAR